MTSSVEAQQGLRGGAGGHLVPLNAAAFLGHCVPPSSGRENEEGDGRNNSPPSHSVISQTHFLSFYSMPDPGTEIQRQTRSFPSKEPGKEDLSHQSHGLGVLGRRRAV